MSEEFDTAGSRAQYAESVGNTPGCAYPNFVIDASEFIGGKLTREEFDARVRTGSVDGAGEQADWRFDAG